MTSKGCERSKSNFLLDTIVRRNMLIPEEPFPESELVTLSTRNNWDQKETNLQSSAVSYLIDISR